MTAGDLFALAPRTPDGVPKSLSLLRSSNTSTATVFIMLIKVATRPFQSPPKARRFSCPPSPRQRVFGGLRFLNKRRRSRMPGKSEVIKVVIAGGLVFVGTARCNARDVGLPGRSAGDGWGRLRMAGDGWG